MLQAVVVPPSPAIELSFHPSRIFAGQRPSSEHVAGTLVMVIEENEHHIRRLDELDLATMRVFRALDFEKTEFAAFAERDGALYVLTATTLPKRGYVHALHRVDLDSLTISRTAETDGAVPTLHGDHAFPTSVSVGDRNVRLTFAGFCPSSIVEDNRNDACVHYETHRLADLAVTKIDVRLMASRAPDAFRELPLPRPSDPRCATRGIFVADGVSVGDSYFELTFGCCGSPPGGLFQCKK